MAIAAVPVAGCYRLAPQPMQGEIPPDFGPVQNPLPVPPLPREFVMDQISDEIDTYFRIAREERIRLVDNVVTEGWIETHPQIGATVWEPWKQDSTPGFEWIHASLQTVRRFAKVRVIPSGNSYLVDVKVYKELEDFPQPQRASISGQRFRHDTALDIDELPLPFEPTERGWIPMGRDMSLENQILRNIQLRLHSAAMHK